jgi:predicted PurR-regulated permease PerM
LGKRIARWVMVIIAVASIGWLFWHAREALLPFEIGIVLAYLILPLVNRLEKYMPRWTAILVIYIAGTLLFIGFIAYVIPLLWIQISQVIEGIPEFNMQDVRSQINEFPPEVQDAVQEGLNTTYDTMKSNLVSYVQRAGSLLLTSVLQVINTVVFLLGFIIVPIWMFFLLSDYHAGYQTFNRLIPQRIRADFWAIVQIIDRVLSSYIRGQLILGLVVGCAAGLGLSLMRLFGFEVQNILLFAVIAGITELIPYVGPILGAIPAVTMGIFQSPATAIAIAVLYFLIQTLENNFLVPRIIGESVDIHPAVLIVLMIVFGQVFGLLGIILVAPVAAAARDVFRYVYGRLQDDPQPAGVLPEGYENLQSSPGDMPHVVREPETASE